MNTLINLNILTIQTVNENSGLFDSVSNFLTSPFLVILLTSVFFLGVVFQLYSKKINAAGILSLLAILLLFAGYILQGTLTTVTIVLFAIGVMLVIIEIFVVGAILGIIGFSLIVFSIITLGNDISTMTISVVIALILAILEWVILVKIFNKRIRFLDKVVLKDATDKESGYTSHDDMSYLVGKTAQTLTDLRPSGMIDYEGKRIDAVSDGSFILRQRTVKILEVEGTRVVVREIPQ